MGSAAWQAASNAERGLAAVWTKKERVPTDMQLWGKNVFGSIRTQIDKLKTRWRMGNDELLLPDAHWTPGTSKGNSRIFMRRRRSCINNGLEWIG